MSTGNAAKTTPVVTVHEPRSDLQRYLIRLVPAALISLAVHAVLLLLFVLLSPSSQADTRSGLDEGQTLTTDLPTEEPLPLFTMENIGLDPRDPEEANTPGERIAAVSVPGTPEPNQAIGLRDSTKDVPVNVPAPAGFGMKGWSGGITDPLGGAASFLPAGGIGPGGLPLNPGFQGRSAAARDQALHRGGGTSATEVAVARGLKWLVRQQLPDGRWMLNGPTLAPTDRGTEANDVAATALGLLPMLAAGMTHKPGKDNPYDKNVAKGLQFLMRMQDRKTGYFGVSMYGHGLAAITLCEAYGLSQDPALRRSAQAALNLIVNTQHETGGWRYGPQKQSGDLSISGWQIMALKSGQMAGLDVPAVSMRKAMAYLDRCSSSEEGYGYTGPGNSPRMTAVGLLCRQYIQGWGPAHPRLRKAIDQHLKPNAPDRQDVYYSYYATQVMHQFGGEAWQAWNLKMRTFLLQKQEANENSSNYGSWSAQGDPYGRVGGRLMTTSLNLLTLEVYYRYLPLYYREAGFQADVAAKKAL